MSAQFELLGDASENQGAAKRKTSPKHIEMSDSDTQKHSHPLPQPHLTPFSSKLLSFGFVVALVLATLCLILGIYYLFEYLSSANAGIGQLLDKVATQQIALGDGRLETLINGRLVMARLGLLSCGVLAGFAFAFLGFALFLLGVRETMDASFKSETYQASAARMSPGVFLILVAAVLVGVCATRETPFDYSLEKTKATGPNATATPSPGPNNSPSPDTRQHPELAPRISP